MKFQLYISFVSILFLFACTGPKQEKVAQMEFSSIEPLLHKNNDTVYVINFWATWCKPCVDEIPEFEKINREFNDKKVKVILVSLDFPSKYNELLLPFIEKNDIQSRVIHLTEVNANSWIDKVNPDWSGAIPATLIYKKNEKDFYEGKLSYDELKKSIELKL